jgi:hypothetical protein
MLDILTKWQEILICTEMIQNRRQKKVHSSSLKLDLLMETILLLDDPESDAKWTPGRGSNEL